jgi:hypothetical protein
MTENRSGRFYPPECIEGSKPSINCLQRAPPIVFPADAGLGGAPRGLEREPKCPGATQEKASA